MKKKEKYTKPVLKLFSSTVPKSFIEKFPAHDKNLFSKNLKVITA